MENKIASNSLVKAIVATAQIMGNDLSDDAGRMMCADLAEYAEPAVLVALQRTRREVKGRLTVADVIARIDDGRPGPNEAWAAVPRSEDKTVVWTEEMAVAMQSAQPLLDADDDIAARMAFIEHYQRELTYARVARKPVRWQVSPGHDKIGREGPLRAAVEAGRITQAQALQHLPNHEFTVPLALPRGTEEPKQLEVAR